MDYSRVSLSCGNSMENFSLEVSSKEKSDASLNISASTTAEYLPETVRQSISGVFEDFEGSKATKPAEAPSNFIKNIPILSRSKDGSKKVQQYIAKASPEDIKLVVEIILPIINDLMVDVYGNYMCQTLFKSCSPFHRLDILRALSGRLLAISKHGRGTHALQTLVSLTSLPEEEFIYKTSFTGYILEMAMHPNASYVLQKLLQSLKNRFFIIEELRDHVTALVVDKQGLCVLKKCISNYDIFERIASNASTFMQDPYGNYAVQIVIDFWKSESVKFIAPQISGKVPQLCIQKFSSNVIEKCLQVEEMKPFVLQEMHSEENLKIILNSNFGCFVARTAIKSAPKDFVEDFRASFRKVKPYLHTKSLKNRWEEIEQILNSK